MNRRDFLGLFGLVAVASTASCAWLTGTRRRGRRRGRRRERKNTPTTSAQNGECTPPELITQR
jgi:hypothetical protein